MDYAPMGHSANEAGSGVFITEDGGTTWIDRISGKSKPEIAPGNTDGLVAGFHGNTVRLADGRLLAMARGQGKFDIDGKTVMSYSADEGKTWTYRASQFPDIGGGKRLVLKRLNEGPLMLVSFEGKDMFVALSMDEGETWPVKKVLAKNTSGYLAATQTPDNSIHLITSKEYCRFNLPWITH
jgi:Neuraminidase (sialidase)